MGQMSADRMVVRLAGDGSRRRRPDTVAVEEPLELRIGGAPLAVTMRTPGADFDLAAGFLVSEGVVRKREDLAAMRACAGGARGEVGTGRSPGPSSRLDIVLAPHVPVPAAGLARAFPTSSACGVCGKDALDAVTTRSSFPIADDPVVVDPEVLCTLPDQLRHEQAVFDRTGGLHAAAVFDGRSGTLLVLREDVGRHNAVDKVVGWALRAGRLPLTGTILLVSGRASFELVQKACMAGIPFLAAVSAPSSLAVDLAAATGMSLVGFLRGPSMVVYTGEHRVGTPVPPNPWQKGTDHAARSTG